jgi:hypothetical protein
LVAVLLGVLLLPLAGCAGTTAESTTGVDQPTARGPAAVSDDDEDDEDDDSSARDSAGKEFCTKYGEMMRTLTEGGERAYQETLPQFVELLSSAPADFGDWAHDMLPWAQGMVDGTDLEPHVAASEEAGYQIANRCQFVGSE